MGNFLEELSGIQREAVCFNNGPSLVVAGAGSGKTRVLTYKIAQLIDEGIRPSSILALTFTNKAAREMKDRIGKLVGDDNSKRLWMGTFHSIFSRILRKEAELIGFTADFTIYDTTDSHNLIKAIIKERKLDDKVYSPKKVANRISQMKNDLVTAEAYRSKKEFHDYDLHQRMPLFGDLYKYYTVRCQKANAMDFDDLLLYTNLLFRDHPDILAKYQNIFKFILVDEYQDTNFSQFLIVQKLANKSHKVCVVGDDAQSIYSFRGARIENILKFRENYPECKVFKLEQNYRSTPNIVSVANSLIKKNEGQIPKNVFSERNEGSPVLVMNSYSETDESLKVSQMVENLKQKAHLRYSDFAILYRTNAQSRILEKTFRQKGIPYKLWGSTSFYERKEILDTLGYIRLAINNNDEEAFKRIINTPARGIGDTTVSKILETAHNNDVSCWTVLSDPMTYALPVNAGTLTKLAEFKKLMDSLVAVKEEKDAYEFVEMVVHNSGMWTALNADKSPEGVSRLQNVEELLNGLSTSAAQKLEEEGEPLMVADFMAEVALMTSLDDNDTDDKVTLMTVHSAKGLEFKNVFIVGVEEELFPSSMSTGSAEGIEEERRLFYVAITRAEDFCVISYAKSRMKNGAINPSNPSRFIKDIDSEMLDFSMAPDYRRLYSNVASDEEIEQRLQNFRPRHDTFVKKTPPEQPRQKYHFNVEPPKVGAAVPPKRNLTPLSRAEDNSIRNLHVNTNTNVKVGDKVVHAQFGMGVVTKLEGAGTPMAKIVVHFQNVGEKKLILKYANIKIV
ncbi:MAG: UvrD-helicase domain-containing protein [Paludibacteraceae bacterium]|nr:UvrD-helicase domain-containing protein [Paludibacteraceae bacterium]